MLNVLWLLFLIHLKLVARLLAQLPATNDEKKLIFVKNSTSQIELVDKHITFLKLSYYVSCI